MAEAVLHDVDAHGDAHDVDPIDHRPPLILGAPDFHAITEAVARPLEWKPPLGWWIVLGISLAMLSLLGVAVGWLFWEGIGVWGNQIPVAWAWDITNFVFWVGIGHAGTLISAVLFLVRQRWRTSINRAAEAMTLFAVACALLFPTIHTGRPWLDYWMMPVPNQMAMWPQFRSPLMWDVFAVSIYGTVSLLFWYVGLIPDLATMRDRSRPGSLAQKLNGIFALGWRGSHRQWHHYERAYLLLAGLATPLVLSVHSVVSFDFATSQLPGWHTTIFPPYFVAGAIFSGLAMVITLMVICRVAFKMEHIINLLHFDRMARLILATGSIVGYAYATEFFVAWYSGNLYEFFAFRNRAMGPYAWAYWTMVTCNVVVPQLFWFKKARVHIPLLFIASIFINIGMWFERFVIIVTSLHRDFMPANWDYFRPTIWDISTLIGSFGLFFTLFTLFVRFLPMVAIAEVKGVLPQAHAQPHVVPPACRTGRKKERRRERGSGQHRRRHRLGGARGVRLAGGPLPGGRARARRRLRALGRPQPVPRPRPRARHGAQALHGAAGGAGARPRRRRGRHGAAVVGVDAGLPAGRLGQAVLQLAGLRADHVRVRRARRRHRGGARLPRLLQAAAPPPPAVRVASASSVSTDDRFFISIEAADPRFDRGEHRAAARARRRAARSSWWRTKA